MVAHASKMSSQDFSGSRQDVTSLPASAWEAVLKQVQDVLEGCVELAVVNWFGSSQNFKRPIVEPSARCGTFPQTIHPSGLRWP